MYIPQTHTVAIPTIIAININLSKFIPLAIVITIVEYY